ncbi:MAG: zinc-ribbon domain-containing protein [Crocinitomicaceae bacterium]|nr:zinc-ribbon domain-containing protein [Crocinitomicaceae bacterium]
MKPKLNETHPHLCLEWHPTNNGGLKPQDVSRGSDKKISWKCNKGEGHEWISTVANRVSGKGCPVCAGRKVVPSNCLQKTNPILAKQWHPTKNGDLKPTDFTFGSHEKIYWKCDNDPNHVWKAQIKSRSSGVGCPFCANLKIDDSNNLEKVLPEIAKQWHPFKNGDIKPSEIAPRAKKSYWWKCELGDDHEWESSVDNRSKAGCPICSNRKTVRSNALIKTHPKLAAEWHPTQNVHLNPANINAGSNKNVWWKCKVADDHEWKTQINKRTASIKPSGCPMCQNLKVVKSNCLATTHPDLIKRMGSK